MWKKLLEDLRSKIQQDLQEELFLSPLKASERVEIEEKFQEELGHAINSSYIDLLQMTDGLVYEGIFLYSAISRKYPDSDGVSMELIDLNLMYREDAGLDNHFIVYGEADMELVVHDLNEKKFQIRDKVGFDTVYEEYDSMEQILIRIIEMIHERVWG